MSQTLQTIEYSVNRHADACLSVWFWFHNEAEPIGRLRINVRRRLCCVVVGEDRQVSCEEAVGEASAVLADDPCPHEGEWAQALKRMGACGVEIKRWFRGPDCLPLTIDVRALRVLDIVCETLSGA